MKIPTFTPERKPTDGFTTLLNWINAYLSPKIFSNVTGRFLFTSDENEKELTKIGCDTTFIRTENWDVLDDPESIFSVWLTLNFNKMNDESYRMIFRLYPDRVVIVGITPFASYFGDIEATKLKDYLKSKLPQLRDFEFDFEIEKSWEEALDIFKSLLTE